MLQLYQTSFDDLLFVFLHISFLPSFILLLLICLRHGFLSSPPEKFYLSKYRAMSSTRAGLLNIIFIVIIILMTIRSGVVLYFPFVFHSLKPDDDAAAPVSSHHHHHLLFASVSFTLSITFIFSFFLLFHLFLFRLSSHFFFFDSRFSFSLISSLFF